MCVCHCVCVYVCSLARMCASIHVCMCVFVCDVGNGYGSQCGVYYDVVQ